MAMKKTIALLLALMLMTGAALAANSFSAVNDAVSRAGFKAASAKNKAGITGCWLTEEGGSATLQWADKGKTYTVAAQPAGTLRLLYARIAGMAEWDTCAYTIDGKAQFAYNAPDMNAARNYKTLSNYVKYVGEYVDKLADADETPARGYVLNTSTKKFHRPDCASAKLIKAENREQYAGDREALIKMGYVPCKNCDP